jgi:hypothetical protein
MSRILVMSEPSSESGGVITLDEQISSAHLRSDHHAAQLIERVGWAVHDADDRDREDLT